jgi:rod shape-determining protein MreD
MNNIIFKNIIRFILLVLLQIFVFNKIQLFGYLNPYIYILFILLLPLEIPKHFLLICAFFLGFSIDYLSNTIGINTISSLLIAFLRSGLIRILSPRLDIIPGMQIGIRDFGFKWIFLYSSILILVHHISLFFLEVFRFTEIIETLKRSLFSAIFTIIIVIISQYLFYRPKK